MNFISHKVAIISQKANLSVFSHSLGDIGSFNEFTIIAKETKRSADNGVEGKHVTEVLEECGWFPIKEGVKG